MNLTECKELCDSIPECMGFDMKKNNSRCYLKNNLANHEYVDDYDHYRKIQKIPNNFYETEFGEICPPEDEITDENLCKIDAKNYYNSRYGESRYMNYIAEFSSEGLKNNPKCFVSNRSQTLFGDTPENREYDGRAVKYNRASIAPVANVHSKALCYHR
tara:strand:+ start:104 stop:580 length:477 start_codon:yes stop_codon:yes gene_type:complete